MYVGIPNELQLSESKSLALHTAVAAKLLADPQVLHRARERAAAWLRDGSAHRWYADAWLQVLAGQPAQIAEFLTDVGQRACALRQNSPFAGALTAQERKAVLQPFERRANDEPRAA